MSGQESLRPSVLGGLGVTAPATWSFELTEAQKFEVLKLGAGKRVSRALPMEFRQRAEEELVRDETIWDVLEPPAPERRWLRKPKRSCQEFVFDSKFDVQIGVAPLIEQSERMLVEVEAEVLGRDQTFFERITSIVTLNERRRRLGGPPIPVW